MLLAFILKTKKKTFLIGWLITVAVFLIAVFLQASWPTVIPNDFTRETSPVGYFLSLFLYFDIFLGVVSFFLLVFKDQHSKHPNFVSKLHNLCLTIWLVCVSVVMLAAYIGSIPRLDYTFVNLFNSLIPIFVLVGFVTYIGSLVSPNDRQIIVEKPLEVQERKSDKLEDLLFVPKKKNRGWTWLLVSTISILLVIFAYGILSALVSNNFDELHVENASEIFPIGLLEVRDMSSRWVGNTMYVKATIKNNTDRIASNIMVRMDCYQDKNLTQIFDTRYIEITGVAARGAFTFEEPVQINHVGQFWYNLRIESAD